MGTLIDVKNALEAVKKSQYAGQVYDILKKETRGLGSVYEDFIIEMVGRHGLRALQRTKLLETCGVINERRLYVLIDRNE